MMDLGISVVVVFVVIAVFLPMFFPHSVIDPFGLSGKKSADIVSTDGEGNAGPTDKEGDKKPADKDDNSSTPNSPNPQDIPGQTEEKKDGDGMLGWIGKHDWKKALSIILAVVGTITFIAITAYVAVYLSRLATYKSLSKEMAYFKVIPASDFKLPNIAYAKYFLINLSKHLQSPWDPLFLATPWCRVVYRKKMEDGNVEMVIGVPKDRTDGFINSFKAYYTKAQLIEYFEIYEDSDGNRYKITSPTELLDDENYGVTEFRLKYARGDQKLHPIMMYTGKSDEMDPLEALVASMGAGEVDMDEVVVDVTLKPVWSKFHLYDKGKKYIDKIRGNMSDLEDLPSILNEAAEELFHSGSNKSRKRRPVMTEYTRTLLQQIKMKCSAPERAYATNIRVYIRCKNPEHTVMKLKGVVDGFDALTSANELETEAVINKKSLWNRIYMGFPHPMKRMTFSTAEIVSFVRVLGSDSPMFIYFDHNDTMAIRAPSGFWEDDTIEYEDLD